MTRAAERLEKFNQELAVNCFVLVRWSVKEAARVVSGNALPADYYVDSTSNEKLFGIGVVCGVSPDHVDVLLRNALWTDRNLPVYSLLGYVLRVPRPGSPDHTSDCGVFPLLQDSEPLYVVNLHQPILAKVYDYGGGDPEIEEAVYRPEDSSSTSVGCETVIFNLKAFAEKYGPLQMYPNKLENGQWLILRDISCRSFRPR